MDKKERMKLIPDLLKECMKVHEEFCKSGKLHTALPPLESFTQEDPRLSQDFLEECIREHDEFRNSGVFYEVSYPLCSTPQEFFPILNTVNEESD